MIIITTTTLPIGVDGVAYSQTIQTSGGVAPLAFTITSGALPTGLTIGASSGVISGTPSLVGTYNFTVEVEDADLFTDTKAYTVSVYEALVPDPTEVTDAVVGDQIQFSATGGSGNYQWSVDGGNLINPTTGFFTAVNGGTATVTVVDLTSGQVALITVTIASQAQFCVTGDPVEDAVNTGTPCCEFNVECGSRLQLRVPSFHIVADGNKEAVVYGNLVQAVTGEASALQSRSASAGATGNEVSFARDAYFEIVTSFDMAQVSNGEVGIGWSGVDADSEVASIEHAVVWYTDTGTRYVDVRHFGTVEDTFEILQGDVVSFGNFGGVFQLWINSVLVLESAESAEACGNVFLDVGIETANKTIGGYVENLTWSIDTAGAPSEVGIIDANGVYTSPSNPLVGVIEITGSLNNARFFVRVRNIQPTPIFTKAQPFLLGRKAAIWVTNQQATDRDIIRIASDGSPDALQNPGMIYLGILEASATFAEEIEYQDFDNDEGTYFTAVASEKAMLSGTFLEVRDLDKLAVLMQHATLHPTHNGVREISVGGKTCGGCDLRAVLVVEAGSCGEGWDVIYMPRVQNNGNLSLEIGKKTNSKYELSLRVLPDSSLARGKQLYSIYQMSNCGTAEGQSCEPSQTLLSSSSDASS
jgi:hypothetical protein